ncbi:hypothetical protein Musp01_27960 [Muricauda sp. NBRC 101325]|nr:hypothetical protein Musp01_27960 [Muricauda sp. NBRC 101325]
MGCIWSCKNNATQMENGNVPIPVQAVTVQQQDIAAYHTFNGVTVYQKKENIRAHVTGYISWLPYELGSSIRAGQTFAHLRTKEQDALREAVLIDSTLEKFSQPLGIQSNGTGIITALNVQKNDYVAEGDLLATIAEPSSLVVQVNVPFVYENNLGVGTPCEIILGNDRTIVTQISGSLPIIDPIPQSHIFLIALPKEQLPESLNVQVRIMDRGHKGVKVLPVQAVQSNELMTDFWVMKVVQDTLAVKQRITLGLQTDAWTEVASDSLQVNDKVVTEGAYQMQDSTLISVQ